VRIFSSLFVCLALSGVLLAQRQNVVKHGAPTTCGADPVLAADGREIPQDAVAPGSEVFYTINVKGGHSYSVEVWDTLDATAMVSPTIQVLKSDCVTAVSVSDTTSMDPDLSSGFSKRASWSQTADATLQVGIVNPDQVNPYVYQARVTDTTLHSPRWSTLSGFTTHYGFLNNTSVDITGFLTLTSIIPRQTYSGSITIPAHNEVFVAIPSSSFNIPANLYGFADFQFAGAPGAITADGYFQSVTNGVFSIAPTTFGPPNFQH
jgi:hypothetical protein